MSIIVKRITITIDTEADAAYIKIKDPIDNAESSRVVEVKSNKSQELSDILLDFSKEGKLLGIEVLSAERLLPDYIYKEER